MRAVFLLLFVVSKTNGEKISAEKQDFCNEVKSCTSEGGQVCGIKRDGDRFHLKIFEDECELLQFGCQVDNEKNAYGIINMEYCNVTTNNVEMDTDSNQVNRIPDSCAKYKCSNEINNDTVCAIRPHETGFKVRLFINKCHVLKYNCEKKLTFEPTDLYICEGVKLSEDDINRRNPANNISDVLKSKFEALFQSNFTETFNIEKDTNSTAKRKKKKNLIVVNAAMFDMGGGINDTINNFFAATHVFDLPLRNMGPMLDKDTRRRIVTELGPVMVYTPWVVIPKNFSFMKDPMHWPTLASCFHRCPLTTRSIMLVRCLKSTECPDTYTPVCGVPGIEAREPRLMFKNHCLMDAAQCKMRWDTSSSTSDAASYKESSFLFCLGDVLNGLYRFLPLVRTLQHMGRLKKKGRFFQQIRNMRFFNEFLPLNPHLMG